MPLTDRQIRTAKPTEKPYKLGDGGGLFLQITPKGSKLWRLKYRFDGKEKLLSLGAYPDVPLRAARMARDDAKSKLAASVDPSVIRKLERAEKEATEERTFAALATAYLEKKKRDGIKLVTIRKNRWLLDMANADFGDVPADKVKAPLILKTLQREEAKGNLENAKRLKTVIGSVLRFGIALGWLDADPTPGLRGAIATRRTKSHAAITDPEKFGELLRSIDAYDGQLTTKYALKLIALLAPRPGELRQAKWEEFDFEKRIWSVPEERMKMGRPHRVPLSAAAVDLLEELRRLTGNSEFLFPALTSNVRPMSENTLNQALRRMGYGKDEHTSHGFRATFATLANESGKWHPDAIERALAHAEKNAVRAAYARSEFWDERVKMVDWWTEITSAMRDGKTG
ncbi:tyrosine-type recombinase/integrase [Parvularcula marina]|uniref:tyrosine-type recombinase/integrase n=1 Tax=Parvularcula marina TaxID=2292771 RepID=UPI003511642C